MTFESRQTRELKERLHKAWRCFGSQHDTLCCHRPPLRKRLELLDTTVRQTLLWGCGSWNLSRRDADKLNNIQGKMERKMLGLAVQYGESKGDWVERSNRRLKILCTLWNRPRWETVYYKQVYAWAGHIARYAIHDPSRLTLHVQRYKDLAWLAHRKKRFGSQLHAFGRLKVWRWESIIAKQVPDWMNAALDGPAWQQRLDHLAASRNAYR